jgi:hypothetical protein
MRLAAGAAGATGSPVGLADATSGAAMGGGLGACTIVTGAAGAGTELEGVALGCFGWRGGLGADGPLLLAALASCGGFVPLLTGAGGFGGASLAFFAFFPAAAGAGAAGCFAA